VAEISHKPLFSNMKCFHIGKGEKRLQNHGHKNCRLFKARIYIYIYICVCRVVIFTFQTKHRKFSTSNLTLRKYISPTIRNIFNYVPKHKEIDC